MKLNEKIINLRKKEGMTQEELSFKLNVSRQAISKREVGESEPDIKNILNLSKIFNVSLEYLLYEDITNIEYYKKNKYEIYKDPFFIINILSIIIFIISLLIPLFVDLGEEYVSN